MQPFIRITSTAAPYVVANIDTDKIIPKQYLKTIHRSGLGKALFDEVRYDENGTPLPDFILNQPTFSSAKILISGENFGCGSSREHAVWALSDFGIRCVIAPSFADIFYNNCTKNGVLPAKITAEEVAELESFCADGTQITVDLEEKTIIAGEKMYHFTLEDSLRERLLNGWDDISMTEQKADEITAYEQKLANEKPWITRS